MKRCGRLKYARTRAAAVARKELDASAASCQTCRWCRQGGCHPNFKHTADNVRPQATRAAAPAPPAQVPVAGTKRRTPADRNGGAKRDTKDDYVYL